MDTDLDDGLVTAESGTLALLNRSEIEAQITTAHKFPRSISSFRREVMDMVTISENVAQECIYALPRDGKVVEGPSARFAEVVANAWGNARAGARVVSDAGDFVTAQGVFHDLQKNVAITYEVQRRITTKAGKRFGSDMIGVTANAACSIALRNAILKGVPKAFWSEMYEGARRTAMGDVKTLPNRRAEAFKAFQGYGITQAQIFAKLGIGGEADIGQEGLLILRGLLTAIKDGDTTPEQAFAADDAPKVSIVPLRKSAATVAPAEPAQDGNAQVQNVGATAGTQHVPVEPTGECISPAVAKNLTQRFEAMELSFDTIRTMIQRHGGKTVETLTAAQADAIKAELLALS